MSASVLRSPYTRTHTARLTHHARCEPQACASGDRVPLTYRHTGAAWRALTNMEENKGMVVGSQRRRRALAADCDVQDSARQLFASARWLGTPFRSPFRSARLPGASAWRTLSARRAPLWLRVGLCPPWFLSLSGRLAPPSRPWSNSPAEKTNPSVEATFSMGNSLRD